MYAASCELVLVEHTAEIQQTRHQTFMLVGSAFKPISVWLGHLLLPTEASLLLLSESSCACMAIPVEAETHAAEAWQPSARSHLFGPLPYSSSRMMWQVLCASRKAAAIALLFQQPLHRFSNCFCIRCACSNSLIRCWAGVGFSLRSSAFVAMLYEYLQTTSLLS